MVEDRGTEGHNEARKSLRRSWRAPWRRVAPLAAAVVALSMAIGLSACGGDSSSSSSGDSGGSTTKIGFILPKTGSLAAIGGAFERGYEAAEEYWNADPKHGKIEIESCDSQSGGPGALACYQRLRGSVDAFAGPSFYLELASVKDQAATGDVPVMTAVPNAEPEAGSALFQNVPTVETATQTGIEYLQDHGAKRLAFLSSNDPPGEASREAAESSGADIVANEAFDPTATDITPQAENIARGNPDALMAWTAGPQVITALRGLATAGVSVPTMLNFSSMSIPLLEEAGSAAGSNLDFLGTAAFVPETIKDSAYRKRVEEFSKVYDEKFQTAPDFNGLAIADTVLILAEAAEVDGSENIKERLESGEEFPGLVFDAYTFSEDEHVGQSSGEGLTILNWNKAGNPSWTVAPE